MKTFVHMVNERMQVQRLSIRKVAKEAGMDPSFLSKVLAGKRTPPANEKILKQLAKCLKIDPLLLVISTGIIPSELQTFMEQPEFLKRIPEILSKAVHKPAALGQPKNQKREVRQAKIAMKSSELSEDLL